MSKLISHNKVKKSTKVFHCDGCISLMEFGSFQDFINHFNPTQDEILTLDKAKEHHYKIRVGEPYIKQFIVDEGDKWVFRCIPEIYQILEKYNFLD